LQLYNYQFTEMKYISGLQIKESLLKIESINQFFGFTFLAGKSAQLPVGETVSISLDSINQQHLEGYYRIDPRSQYYFRVFKYNNTEHLWLRPDYSGKGLQKLNTTTFKPAFIHTPGSRDWGWDSNYVRFLQSKLNNNEPISAFHMAVWLFRNKPFDSLATRENIIEAFFTEFNISTEEKKLLFTTEVNTAIDTSDVFAEEPVSWEEIIRDINFAPDVEPANGGILSLLEMDGIGPVTPLLFEPASRLNIITGDNGLGKTFILETAWWALTGTWAGIAAYPNRQHSKVPKIKYSIAGKNGGKVQSVTYSQKENAWSQPDKRSTISGLVVYARVDGSFAVWDPAAVEGNLDNGAVIFDKSDVWDGNYRIEGLVRDWTKWQDKPEKYPFNIFEKVIAKMSPPEMATLRTGQPVRILGDRREIPTLVHTYGDVPIVHESAGIKRIITLAYLIVWVWNEHKIISSQFGKKMEKRMVILIDELEAHLHPKWQRAILPALLDVAKILSADLELQLIVASHSPLVLASSEAVFNIETDKLFHLETKQNGKISFKNLDFVKYGHINSWLESDVFDLKEARSNDSQIVLRRAIEIQKKENASVDEIREITNDLLEVLSTEDKFWNRWIFYAKKHGIEV